MHVVPVAALLYRECAFPYKPSPAALQHICECWGISPSECVMVGDSAKVSGQAVGEQSVSEN
jgi:FMN phosphatase YigB (HAD superfamily)